MYSAERFETLNEKTNEFVFHLMNARLAWVPTKVLTTLAFFMHTVMSGVCITQNFTRLLISAAHH